MSSCINSHLNMVRSKSDCCKRSSRETATTFKFVYGRQVQPYGKIGRTISKFGRTMSDDWLSFPALLQDGTFIGIYTLKWPIVFIKDSFFFKTPYFGLKKIRSPSFQDHNFSWPGHFLRDPVIPINNEPSLRKKTLFLIFYCNVHIYSV